jgi:DNA-binding NarL/FixJ family response regulator
MYFFSSFGIEVIDKDISKIVNNDTIRESTIIKVDEKNPSKKLVRIHGIEVSLNERELNIVQMILDAKTTLEMSNELFIAEGRIRNIITEIISKLMVKDKTQLAVFALKNNL